MIQPSSDPGPGAKGDPAHGGAGATNPASSVDVEKLVASAVEKAVTKVSETYGGKIESLETQLKTQAENHANQIRRLKGQGGSGEGGQQGNGKPSSDLEAELEAEREEKRKFGQRIAELENAQKQARIDNVLNDAISGLSNLAEGAAKQIRAVVRSGLSLNSAQEVIFVDGNRHISLADKLAEVSAYPGYQAAANRGGAGRPGEAVSIGQRQVKTISASDKAAIAKNFDAIAAGDVVVVGDD